MLQVLVSDYFRFDHGAAGRFGRDLEGRASISESTKRLEVAAKLLFLREDWGNSFILHEGSSVKSVKEGSVEGVTK